MRIYLDNQIMLNLSLEKKKITSDYRIKDEKILWSGCYWGSGECCIYQEGLTEKILKKLYCDSLNIQNNQITKGCFKIFQDNFTSPYFTKISFEFAYSLNGFCKFFYTLKNDYTLTNNITGFRSIIPGKIIPFGVLPLVEVLEYRNGGYIYQHQEPRELFKMLGEKIIEQIENNLPTTTHFFNIKRFYKQKINNDQKFEHALPSDFNNALTQNLTCGNKRIREEFKRILNLLV